MKISYLVIWQRGNNNQSRTESPIDVRFSQNEYEKSSAKEKYDKIIGELKKVEHEEGSDNITILGIYKL